MRGLRRFSTMLVLGAVCLVGAASVDVAVRPSGLVNAHTRPAPRTVRPTQPGHLAAETGALRAVLSLPGHLENGMHSTLVVH